MSVAVSRLNLQPNHAHPHRTPHTPTSTRRARHTHLVKSEMLSAIVSQYPTCADSAGTNAAHRSGHVSSRLGADSIGPKPPAALSAQPMSASASRTSTGAENFSMALMDSMPRVMIAT